MDVGIILWTAITGVGAVGTCVYCWATRRRPQPEVTACRSYVRRVAPPVVRGEGPSGDAGQGVVALPASPRTSSLAVEAWASIAGGSEWEARIETAKRRIAQHALFGDAAIRRRHPDPTIVAAVESYLAHPSQQAPTSWR